MFNKQAEIDIYWAGYSILFVWLALLVHLKSFLLACYSIMLIIFSFPVTQLIYTGIFRISYLSNLHLIVIYIVIIVAVNDIFLTYDAWKQSGSIQ